MEDEHLTDDLGADSHVDDPALGETAAHMKRAVSDFASARIELATLEAKEAVGFGVSKAVQAAIMAGSLFFTWSLILAAIVGIVAPHADRWLEQLPWLSGWAAVLLGLGIIHAIVAIIFFCKLRKKPSAPFFELTKQEIENDKQWLKKKT